MNRQSDNIAQAKLARHQFQLMAMGTPVSIGGLSSIVEQEMV